MDAGSGSVRLDAITATDVRVETGSGGVQLTIRNSPTVLNIEAGSGGVTLGLPAAASVVVDIESGGGGIETGSGQCDCVKINVTMFSAVLRLAIR